jgi:hypothetical protein
VIKARYKNTMTRLLSSGKKLQETQADVTKWIWTEEKKTQLE